VAIVFVMFAGLTFALALLISRLIALITLIGAAANAKYQVER
jgi:hypothetical protein